MKKIRCAVVDDEPLSRDLLRRFIADETELELVGEASSGMEALEVLPSLRPELLFLDVQMPEMSGFELLEALQPEQVPVTVFVTAYDSYALKAFEVHALDYLLKPFDRGRFVHAAQRAVEMISGERRARYAEKLEKALADRNLRRIVIRSEGRLVLLKAAEIDWVEADGNYVRIYASGAEHVMRSTLRDLAEKLPPAQFQRIHRSAIVNVSRIAEILPWYTGEYIVRLASGRELTLSRKYRDEFFEALGQRV